VAEAEVVEVLSRTVFSGARTVFSIVFSGPGTVFSTVTVRARGAGGGAASSRLPPIRPRRNPKSSPITSTPSTSTTNLTSPVFLPGLPLLPSILLSLHSSCRRTHTCYSAPFRAPKQGPPLRVATLRTSYMIPYASVLWTWFVRAIIVLPDVLSGDGILGTTGLSRCRTGAIRTSQNLPSETVWKIEISHEMGSRRRSKGAKAAAIGRFLAPKKRARETLGYFPNSFVGGILRSSHPLAKDNQEESISGVHVPTRGRMLLN
jgi:hypothetical protein